LRWPPGYETFEKVAGVLVMAPWCYFLLVPVARWVGRASARVRRVDLPRPSWFTPLELWAMACSLALLPTLIPALGLWEASMRYSADALGGALVAATLGAFWLVRASRTSRSRLVQAQACWLVVAAGVYTCFTGAFSAVSSYEENLKLHNPELFHWLEAKLSLCEVSQ
jgi:hypothetical protein